MFLGKAPKRAFCQIIRQRRDASSVSGCPSSIVTHIKTVRFPLPALIRPLYRCPIVKLNKTGYYLTNIWSSEPFKAGQCIQILQRRRDASSVSGCPSSIVTHTKTVRFPPPALIRQLYRCHMVKLNISAGPHLL